MRRIKYAFRSERDLQGIQSYLAKDDVDVADRIIAEIRAEIRKLASVPGIGHARPDLLGTRPYLVRTIYQYLIIYRHSDDELTVVRVLHGACDVGNVVRRGLR